MASRRSRWRRGPPVTPGGVLTRHPLLLAAVVGAALVLSVVAAFDPGALAPTDRAVSRVLTAVESGAATWAFRAITELGGGPVVIPLTGVAAAITARRSPALAVAMVLALVARYAVEPLLKEMIGRARPADPLIEVGRFAFPSGHAFGATVGWGSVPAAVRASTPRASPWRWSVSLWAAVVLAVAASRVYLGVHWITDTIASMLYGLLLLAVVDAVGTASLQNRQRTHSPR